VARCGKMERIAAVERRARELARSGRHSSHVTIGAALIDYYPDEARFVFRNEWQKQELDRLCKEAIRRQDGNRFPLTGPNPPPLRA
jgi:hypothetical protein